MDNSDKRTCKRILGDTGEDAVIKMMTDNGFSLICRNFEVDYSYRNVIKIEGILVSLATLIALFFNNISTFNTADCLEEFHNTLPASLRECPAGLGKRVIIFHASRDDAQCLTQV